MKSPEHKQLFNEESIKNLVNKYFNLKEFYKHTTKPICNRPLYKNLIDYVGVAVKK